MGSASSPSTTVSTADFYPKSEPVRRLRRWPEAVVALGLALSIAWTFGLGYGLIKLIALFI